MGRIRRAAILCVWLRIAAFGQNTSFAIGSIEERDPHPKQAPTRRQGAHLSSERFSEKTSYPSFAPASDASANTRTASSSRTGHRADRPQSTANEVSETEADNKNSPPFIPMKAPDFQEGAFPKSRRHRRIKRIRKSAAEKEAHPSEPNLHIAPRQPLYPLIETRTAPERKKFFVRPLIARYEKPDCIENVFLYPFGQDFRQPNHRHGYCFFTLCRYDTKVVDGQVHRKGHFFPFYFYRRGYGPNDCTAVWPLGGTIKNYFGKQRIDWCGWPLYVETQKNGDINHWFPWPILNKRDGQTSGFAFYPLGGHFYNDKKDLRYFLWPLVYNHRFFDKTHTKKGFLPFYAYEKRPNLEDLSIIWPFFGHRREQNPNYDEHRVLWPLWVQGRGEQRTVNRWAPFYTHSERTKGHYRKTWRLWPLLKEQSWIERDIDVQQQQVLYFLVWNQEQYAHATGRFLGKKSHFWPFFSSWNNGQGRKQLQVLSPFSVFFPSNPRVRDIYNPLFHLFRYEKNGDTVRGSALFGLFQEYRHLDTHELDLNWFLLFRFAKTPESKHFSLLKGLFEYSRIKGRVSLRLFWIPLRSHGKGKVHKRL